MAASASIWEEQPRIRHGRRDDLERSRGHGRRWQRPGQFPGDRERDDQRQLAHRVRMGPQPGDDGILRGSPWEPGAHVHRPVPVKAPRRTATSGPAITGQVPSTASARAPTSPSAFASPSRCLQDSSPGAWWSPLRPIVAAPRTRRSSEELRRSRPPPMCRSRRQDRRASRRGRPLLLRGRDERRAQRGLRSHRGRRDAAGSHVREHHRRVHDAVSLRPRDAGRRPERADHRDIRGPRLLLTPNPIVNTASVSSQANEPDLSNNSATTTTLVGLRRADLAITKGRPVRRSVGANLDTRSS